MFVNPLDSKCSILCVLLLTVAVSFVHAQDQDFDQVQIETVKVADGVYMLVGSGGNIGVSTGEDGVFMIDDQFAPLTDKIKAAIAEVSDKSVHFVLNTHWHFDHVGGNENMGEAGAVIVAHENVRKRMSTEQFIEFFNQKLPPSPKVALPVITFTRDVTFHLNGDETYVFHVENAHTDGDAIIHFREANVMHMGDIYFAGMYPFIDVSSGGSVNGIIAAVSRVLTMIDETTKIIPGHGPLSNKSELKGYLNMLTSIRDQISQHINAEKTLEDVLTSKPTHEFDTDWGHSFLKPDQFVEILYKDLSRGQK